MLICGLSQRAHVFDGSDVEIDYAIKNDEFDPLEGISSIQYKLSDKDSDLIDWTPVSPPNTSGTINIPGINKIIASQTRKERELALYVIYSGSKVATGKINYTIVDIVGVTTTSP